MPVISGN